MKDPIPFKDVVLFNDLIMVRQLVRKWDWFPYARLTPEDEFAPLFSAMPVADGGFARAAEIAMVHIFQSCQRQN
jgi:hypothetical protein